MRVDSARVLLRAAVTADPSDFVVFDAYVNRMRELGKFAELRAEFMDSTGGTDGASACRAGVANVPTMGGGELKRRLAEKLARLHDRTACTAVATARGSGALAPRAKLEVFRAAAHAAPALWDVQRDYIWLLLSERGADEATSAFALAVNASPHPLYAFNLRVAFASVLPAAGDSVAVRIAAERDGRPLLLFNALEQLRADRIQEYLMVARRHRGVGAEYRTTMALGATLMERKSDPRAALGPLTRAVSIATQLRSPELAAMALYHRGRAWSKVGEFERAEADLLRARDQPLSSNESYLRMEIHHNLAHAYEGAGRWADAMREAAAYGHHAALADEGGQHMMSKRDAGAIAWKAGWHARARASFVEMVKAIEDRRMNYQFAGEYFERVGMYSRAAEYYRRGLQSPGDHGERVLNLGGLARVFAELGMRDSALAAASRHDEPTVRGGLPRLLPSMLVRFGRTDVAMEIAQLDVREQLAKGSAQGIASSRLQLARAQLAAGRLSDVVRTARETESAAAAAHLVDEQVDAIYLRGVAQARLRSPEGITTLRRALEIIEAAPAHTMKYRAQLALGEALASMGRDVEALTAFERAATAAQRVAGGYDVAIDRVRDHEQRIAPFDGALRILVRRPASAARDAMIYAWSLRKRNALLDQQSLATTTTTSLRQATRALGRRVAILDYVFVDSAAYVLVVTATHSSLVQLPLASGDIFRLSRKVREPFATDGRLLDLARSPFDLAAAAELYRGLFAPIEMHLERADRLIILPDGPLYGVPFAALPRALAGPSYVKAEYLIDRYVIEQSASAATRTSTGLAGTRVLLIVGDVPGAAREQRSVSTAWPEGKVTLMGQAAATERAVRDRARAGEVLHFAVHAESDESDNLASFIQLAEGRGDDGLLHATEIARMRLRGSLVILTACETIPGRHFAGSGPFGIATSFIAAGAGEVIASHWPVGETAADVSGVLHRRLAAGADAATALRDAQLAFRRDPAYAHPFYWGGFVLMTRGGS